MTNGKKDPLQHTQELLRMAAMQTTENAKQLNSLAKETSRAMKEMRTEHNREMKEIRTLFKQVIRRIAV